MYGKHAYEHALRGELLNEIRKWLQDYYGPNEIGADNILDLINTMMWEAGYMEGEE